MLLKTASIWTCVCQSMTCTLQAERMAGMFQELLELQRRDTIEGDSFRRSKTKSWMKNTKHNRLTSGELLNFETSELKGSKKT